MKVIDNDMVVVIDCDDTLVMWNNNEYWINSPDKVEVTDPIDNATVYLIPHKQHIALVGKYKAQGYTVIVWSAAGYRWAEAVVKALKIENNVDFCMSKPLKYVDDLRAEHILGSRVYIPIEQKDRVIKPGEVE